MSNYQITERVLKLAIDLVKEGYSGDPYITKSYASGTKEILGDSPSITLNGFCKETLHIVEDSDTGEIVLVGRYNEVDRRAEDFSVKDIVDVAYRFFRSYQSRGYSEPYGFEKLFEKYGYVTTETVTKTKRVYK